MEAIISSSIDNLKTFEIPNMLYVGKEVLFPFLEKYVRHLFVELSNKSPIPGNGVFQFIFREVNWS
jgi:hypothetical protein